MFFHDKKLDVIYRDTSQMRVLNLAEAGLPEVPVIACTRFDQYVVPYAVHRHPECFEIGLCLRGALTLVSQGQESRILPGDLLVNKPEDEHSLKTVPAGTKYYWMLIRDPKNSKGFLHLPPDVAHDLHEKLNRLPCHITANTAKVKQAFAELFIHYDRPPGPYRTFCLAAACSNLLMALIDSVPRSNAPVHVKCMEQIIASMRAHPESHFRLDELARKARLSSSLFAVRFKQITGLPPSHFLIACRLEEAKRRLASTDTSLTRIALDLGFCAPQHFSTHFKRAFGMTPRAWRDQHRRENAASPEGPDTRAHASVPVPPLTPAGLTSAAQRRSSRSAAAPRQH